MNARTKLAILTLLLVAPTGTVAASPSNSTASENSNDDDTTIINFNGLTDAVHSLVEIIREFTGDWDATIEDILIAVFFKPFRTLAQQLIRAITLVLMNTPTIHPNPAVEEIHREVLLVTFALTGPVLMATGLLHITGPLFGVSYDQVRAVIPKLVAALAFSTVSLPLLQLGVDLSDALVQAFAPSGLTMSISQLAGLSTSLVLVWTLNALLLLVAVLMFVIRDVYLLFVAAISPLLALAWCFPKTKKYADTFIAGWFTALAMAPLDVLVLRLNLALMNGSSGLSTQSVSNWILGAAGFSLLILVPQQLYGASQAAIGQAYTLAVGAKRRFQQYRDQSPEDQLMDWENMDDEEYHEKMKQAREKRRGRDE